MPDSDVRILLNFTKWNKDELLLRLTNENRDEFIANAQVANPFANVDDHHPSVPELNQQNVMCAICLRETVQEVRFMTFSELHVKLLVRFFSIL